MNKQYIYDIEWTGSCHLCFRKTDSKPYMSLIDAKLICENCFEWQNKENEKKRGREKNADTFCKVKQLSPGMEWEIPKED